MLSHCGNLCRFADPVREPQPIVAAIEGGGCAPCVDGAAPNLTDTSDSGLPFSVKTTTDVSADVALVPEESSTTEPHLEQSVSVNPVSLDGSRIPSATSVTTMIPVVSTDSPDIVAFSSTTEVSITSTVPSVLTTNPPVLTTVSPVTSTVPSSSTTTVSRMFTATTPMTSTIHIRPTTPSPISTTTPASVPKQSSTTKRPRVPKRLPSSPNRVPSTTTRAPRVFTSTLRPVLPKPDVRGSRNTNKVETGSTRTRPINTVGPVGTSPLSPKTRPKLDMPKYFIDLFSAPDNKWERLLYRADGYTCFQHGFYWTVCSSPSNRRCLIQPTVRDSIGRPIHYRPRTVLKIHRLTKGERASLFRQYGEIKSCSGISIYITVLDP